MSKLPVMRSTVCPRQTIPRIDTAQRMFSRLRGVRKTSDSQPPGDEQQKEEQAVCSRRNRTGP